MPGHGVLTSEAFLDTPEQSPLGQPVRSVSLVSLLRVFSCWGRAQRDWPLGPARVAGKADATRTPAPPGGPFGGRAWEETAKVTRGLHGPLEATWSEWLVAQKGKPGIERKGDLLEILQLVSWQNWGWRQGFLPPVSELEELMSSLGILFSAQATLSCEDENLQKLVDSCLVCLALWSGVYISTHLLN